MSLTDRRTFGILLAVAILALGVAYHETFFSIGLKWWDDTTFSHGFLVVPIALWTAWRLRGELAATRLAPSWAGLAVLVMATGAWIVARGAGVLVVEQLAAVTILIAVVWSILGDAAARVLMFPLGFLFFAVPLGRALIPLLMTITADVATDALSLSGVPILRLHMYISIPMGSFEVARACGGLNYVIAGLVLGVLYAYLNYKSTTKRVLCVLAFLIVPIVANGLRVYFTILAAYLTDMRYGPGYEHVTFGRIFFILVMLAMFWIGRRWHDDFEPVAARGAGHVSRTGSAVMRPLSVPVAAFALIVLGPAYLGWTSARATAQMGQMGADLARLPAGANGWSGPVAGKTGWKPLYTGAVVERGGVYRNSSLGEVDAYVAVYGIGNRDGAEMISFANVLFAEEHTSLPVVTPRPVHLPDGPSFTVRTVIVPAADGDRLVWTWYAVGERKLTSEFAVKAFEALSFIAANAHSERIVTLSTRLDEQADARLAAFVSAHATCVASGFDGKVCGQ